MAFFGKNCTPSPETGCFWHRLSRNLIWLKKYKMLKAETLSRPIDVFWHLPPSVLLVINLIRA